MQLRHRLARHAPQAPTLPRRVLLLAQIATVALLVRFATVVQILLLEFARRALAVLQAKTASGASTALLEPAWRVRKASTRQLRRA